MLSGADVIVAIESVSRSRDVFVHAGRIERGQLTVGDAITAQVDRACRRRAQANHTATHLLQAALKQVVDPGIGQAGSLVDFDRLRFDFHAPQAVTTDQLGQIETLINGWIAEAHGLLVEEMAIDQAKAAGAVAMFGEKYADAVLGGVPDPSDQGKVILVAVFGNKVITAKQQAGKFIGAIAKLCGGGGGGRPNLAQAGGRDGAALAGALETARTELEAALQQQG